MKQLSRTKELAALRYALGRMQYTVKYYDILVSPSGICLAVFQYLNLPDTKVSIAIAKQLGKISIIHMCPILTKYCPEDKHMTGFWYPLTLEGYEKRVELLYKILKENE